MNGNIHRVAKCLVLIAAAFLATGCAGRGAADDYAGATTITPSPVPAATQPAMTVATAAPTDRPGGTGNITIGLIPADVWISDGDMQDIFPEDLLPTPAP